jgi:hypothetical protein
MPTVAEAAIVSFGDLHNPGIHGRTIMPQLGFVKAMKDYFGLLPDQSTIQFGAELRALSPEEKRDIARGLRSAGIDCADPDQPKVAA